MKIEVSEVEVGDFDLCDVYGEKMKIIAIFVDIFFILQNNDDVNKFSSIFIL